MQCCQFCFEIFCQKCHEEEILSWIFLGCFAFEIARVNCSFPHPSWQVVSNPFPDIVPGLFHQKANITMVALEMQAIVLAAGNGSRMTELSGERPKCLLPVGPLPLVWYPLHMLQVHGFQGLDIISNIIKFHFIEHLFNIHRSDYCSSRISAIRNSTGLGKDSSPTKAGLCHNSDWLGFRNGWLTKTHQREVNLWFNIFGSWFKIKMISP